MKPFVSWGPDPEAQAVNAFSINWNNMLIYAFPPFSLVQKVLAKLERDQTQAVLIVPNWPTAVWFPQMLRLLTQNPLILPKGKTVLHLHHSEAVHPLHRKLQLLAVMCSGKPYMLKEYQEKLVKLCVHPGDQRHNSSIAHTSSGGNFFALNEKLIPFVHL